MSWNLLKNQELPYEMLQFYFDREKEDYMKNLVDQFNSRDKDESTFYTLDWQIKFTLLV